MVVDKTFSPLPAVFAIYDLLSSVCLGKSPKGKKKKKKKNGWY